MNKKSKIIHGLGFQLSPEKICYSHREKRLGDYVYKIENGVVNKKYQRFYCHGCIKKYNLSAYLINPPPSPDGTSQKPSAG